MLIVNQHKFVNRQYNRCLLAPHDNFSTLVLRNHRTINPHTLRASTRSTFHVDLPTTSHREHESGRLARYVAGHADTTAN